jgi:hypothetical protein
MGDYESGRANQDLLQALKSSVYPKIAFSTDSFVGVKLAFDLYDC